MSRAAWTFELGDDSWVTHNCVKGGDNQYRHKVVNHKVVMINIST